MRLLIFLAALLLFFVHGTLCSREISKSIFRDSQLKTQIAPNATFSSGANLNTILITPMRNVGRSSYPKQLSSTDSQQITDYVTGAGLYGLFGISFAGVALVWAIIVLVTSCVCFCCNCCGKSFADRDEDARSKDEQAWQKAYKQKRTKIQICRVIILVHALLSLALLFVWALFAYQVNLDISNSENAVIGASYSVENFINGTSTTFGSISSVTSSVKVKVQNYTDTIVNKLPSETTLNNVKLCINNTKNMLPNITTINAYIDSLYNIIDNLPALSSMNTSVSNIENALKKIKEVDIQKNYNDVLAVNNTLKSLAPQTQQVKSSVLVYKAVVANLTTANATAVIDRMESYFNPPGNLSNSFLLTTRNDLQNITQPLPVKDTRVIAAKLVSISNALQSVSEDPALLMSMINNINYTIVNMPPVSQLRAQVQALTDAFTTINITALDNNLVQLNASIENVKSMTNNLTATMNRLKNIVTTFPSTSVIFKELSKINSTIDQFNCFESIFAIVKDLNSSVVIMSKTISDLVNDFNATKNDIKKIDLTAITGRIDQLNSSVANTNFSSYDSINVTNLLTKLPNIANMRSQANDSNVQFNNYKSQLNTSKILGDITSMEKTLNSSIPDMTQYLSSLRLLNSSLKAVSRQELLAMNSTIYVNCSAAICPATVQNQANTLAAKLDALRIAILGRPNATRFRADVVSAQNSINSLPNITSLVQQVDDALVKLNNVPSLNGVLNNIISANNSMEEIYTFPFASSRSQITSFSNSLDTIPSRQSIKNETQKAKDSIDSKTDFGIDSMFDSIRSFANSVNVTSLFGTIENAVSSIQGQANAVPKAIRPIAAQRDQYADDVYYYDGIRLLITTLVLIWIVPLPLIGIAACFCPRRPCIMIALANVYAWMTVLAFLVMAVTLPLNVVLGDNCAGNTLENTTLSILRSADASLANPTTQDVSVGGKTINISFVPLDVIGAYLSGDCNSAAGNTINSVINSFKSVVVDYSSEVDKFKNLSVSGFTIHPKASAFLDELKVDIVNGTVSILNGFGNMFGCNSVNQVYSTVKDSVCKTTAYTLINVGFMAWMLTFVTLFSSCFGYSTYIFLLQNWVNPKTFTQLDSSNYTQLEPVGSSANVMSNSALVMSQTEQPKLVPQDATVNK